MTPRVVLITGASAGFGRACAEHLGRLGHRVYGTSRRAAFPESADLHSSPLMVPMDVCDDDSVQRAVDFVLKQEGRIDVVVNNAGVGLAGAVEDTSADEARALFETNLFGVLRVCRAVLPALRAQGSGLIVNVSSLGGLVTIPFQGFYSASKYALESMSDALRMELRPFGVHVTLLEPGDFKTGFTGSRVFSAESGEGSAYRDRCQRAVSVMEQDEQNGADPRQVAVLLAKIIASPSPRNRYPVGAWGQRLGVAVRRVLPSALLDKAIRAVYRV
ncbi:MAG: SDR family oxidoreductase [Deltaproteobacteria bacterium]|nr:SDR family oxidoreductase [Deltaproteobacteria bacterium]MBW2416331.1 SDR family oxidoreductase [Deltaproteobacteria bacterium]